jgi:hypothetical protein
MDSVDLTITEGKRKRRGQVARSFGDRQWKAAALTTFLHHPTPTRAAQFPPTLLHNRIPRLLFSFPFSFLSPSLLLLPAAAADPSLSLLPQVPIAGRSSLSPPHCHLLHRREAERERGDGFLGASKNHMMPLPPLLPLFLILAYSSPPLV